MKDVEICVWKTYLLRACYGVRNATHSGKIYNNVQSKQYTIYKIYNVQIYNTCFNNAVELVKLR
jgi:hypothetical protein